MKIALDRSHRTLLVARVRVYSSDGNRRRRLFAAVDTGATHVVIPPDVARSLAYPLESAPGQRIVTGDGRLYPPRIVLARVELGAASAREVSTLCHDLPEECPVDAIIGLSFLTQFHVSFDFDSWEMELVPRSRVEGAS